MKPNHLTAKPSS